MREHERHRDRPEFDRIAIRCFILGVGIAYYASRDAKKVQGIHKAADANIFEGTGT